MSISVYSNKSFAGIRADANPSHRGFRARSHGGFLFLLTLLGSCLNSHKFSCCREGLVKEKGKGLLSPHSGSLRIAGRCQAASGAFLEHHPPKLRKGRSALLWLGVTFKQVDQVPRSLKPRHESKRKKHNPPGRLHTGPVLAHNRRHRGPPDQSDHLGLSAGRLRVKALHLPSRSQANHAGTILFDGGCS